MTKFTSSEVTIPAVSTFLQANSAFENGAQCVYCIDPSFKKETHFITDAQQAREYYDSLNCNEYTPKLITKIIKKFNKSEIARRFLRYTSGKERLDK